MLKYALELLSKEHDRKSFCSGLDSIDLYLQKTARGHLEKGIAITRVLVASDSKAPKPVLGYFTLTQISVEAKGWSSTKGLPDSPVPAIFLSRMGVDQSSQGEGLSRILLSMACQFALAAMDASGGIGLVVDAAHRELLPFYEKFGFVAVGALRLFLPTGSLRIS